MDYILLLEDETPLRHALGRSLREALGVEVAECATLAEAVRALDPRSPSLIVCDLDLPDGTGLDLLPELAVRGLRLPILIISAHLGRFGAELPASPNIDILPKPFEVERLVELSRRRLMSTGQQSPAFAVADYLQLAGMARRSVHLSVHRGDERLGEIVVQDGEPQWAVDQQGEGESAFRRLALLQRAEVICQTLSAPVGQTNLTGSLEHLLIDAARHADELKRQGPRGLEAPIAAPSSSKSPPPPPRRSGGEPSAQQAPFVPSGPPPLPSRAKPPIPPRPSEQRVRAAEPVTGSPPALASAPPAPSQEKTVNLSKPKPSLSNLSSLDPSLKAGARAERAGSVVETTGEIDAETACAVSTMAARDIAEAAAEVGFGKPLAWHISIGESTWYVAHARDELIVSQGGLNKNPGGTLKKLAKAYGA